MFRVATRVGDSFYTLGPVLVLSGHQAFSWGAAPWLVLALAAQLAVDGATGLARTWFADGVAPRAQPQMLWLYLTDACLSGGALAAASDVAKRPALVLLSLPLVALFSIFARERRERLEGTLALSSAYRGAAYLLGDVIDAVDHYTAVHTHQVVELSVSVSRQSRIVAVCDAYNAMTTDRPYRQGRSTPEAVAELRRCAGTQFDSVVVESLERVLADRTPVDDQLFCSVS